VIEAPGTKLASAAVGWKTAKAAAVGVIAFDAHRRAERSGPERGHRDPRRGRDRAACRAWHDALCSEEFLSELDV
jgi:hypothetical protein